MASHSLRPPPGACVPNPDRPARPSRVACPLGENQRSLVGWVSTQPPSLGVKWTTWSLMNSKTIRNQLDELYRSESRRVFASLVRLLNDFDLADDAMHEAFTAAVEAWEHEGVPA